MGLFGPSKLDRQISSSMDRIQGLGLAPEMKTAYQQSQMLAGQGMDAASKQLAIQEGARSTNALISAAKGKRSLLAMAPGLYSSSNDLALRLAANDAMMRRENQMAGIQTGMQFGQAQTELERYKSEQQYNELAAKKARRAQMVSGIIGAVGSIAGAALGGAGTAGGFGKLFGKGAKLLDTASNVASTASNLSSAFVAPKVPRLSSGNMMPGGLYSSGI
jgi:hypothetical protein